MDEPDKSDFDKEFRGGWKTVEVGESFFVPDTENKSLGTTRIANRTLGKRFVSRKEADGFRV